jgi:hypothetical protein
MKIEVNLTVPRILYHATYQPLLKSILDSGLGSAKARKNWEGSVPGVVCLADDKDVAESYAEISELVPEAWIDQIVILKVDTVGLDKSLFFVDRNNQDENTVEYRGVIPPKHLTIA